MLLIFLQEEKNYYYSKETNYSYITMSLQL